MILTQPTFADSTTMLLAKIAQSLCVIEVGDSVGRLGLTDIAIGQKVHQADNGNIYRLNALPASDGSNWGIV